MTGTPISEHQAETKKKESRYLPCLLAIKWDMEKLYERIEKRVDIMLKDGLLEEVQKHILPRLSNISTALTAIGYREAVWYFKDGTLQPCGRKDGFVQMESPLGLIEYVKTL